MNYPGKLIIFTSFYRQQALAQYASSLVVTIMALERLGIEYDYWPGRSDFHVERSINDALSKFANDPEATDFLNIDSDHSWSADAVIRLLLHPELVVAASYKMTNAWDSYTGVIVRDEDGDVRGKWDEQDKTARLLAADRIPAGFMRLKKEVLQKYIEAHPDDYWMDGDRKVYRFFWNEVKDHVFTGMDFCFSDKLKALGYDLWIDPNLKINHWGVTKFEGHLDQYLRNEKAFDEIKRAADGLERAVQGN